MRRPMTPLTASSPDHRDAIGKVRLLLWKNYLLQKRHKIHTLVDIFLPVLFFILCAWIQSRAGSMPSQEHVYTSLSLDSLEPLFPWTSRKVGTNGTCIQRIETVDDSKRCRQAEESYQPITEHRLAFTPNATIFRNLMDRVSDRLKLEKAIAFANSKQLENATASRDLIAGVVFHHQQAVNELPKNLAYSLRFPAELRTAFVPGYRNPVEYNWRTNLLFPDDGYTNKYPDENDGGPPSYWHEGFSIIQNAIADAFVEMQQQDNKKNASMPEIRMQRFPYPSYIINIFATELQVLMPLFFLMSLNYTFMNTVRFISIEKEKQLKEAMKIMGLSSWMHYLSWFLRTILMLSISMVLITLLLTKPTFGADQAIFPNSSFSCLLTFFLGYCICLITFGFVICSFFTRTKSAMTGSTIVWYATSAPFLLTFGKYDNLAGWQKVMYCFCPNTAMAYGFKIIARLEEHGFGLNWHTAFRTVSVYDGLTIAWIFFIMILNACILFLLTLYVENVSPGGFGVAKPWYFIFTKEFWLSLKNYQHFEDNRTISEHSNLAHSVSGRSNFESEPNNRSIGIEIQNLTKKFSESKAAVNQLYLNIYDNHITTLLGQNGAGKTTTISMLTGMVEPTSGTALINGYDIRTNMDSARRSMGFCPQHNILFDELTVREHILFYCSLKGLSDQAAESECRKYIRLLELEGKEDAPSSTLSGGMKRKLSVVIALCGKSKVVFLDEPTSGMDPGARRTLWDILLAEKKDRTILLTTHFMDEADVLSDRIAILAEGELKCAGSTFFLKKRFGTGYLLICAKGTNCDSRLVTDILKNYIPEIRINAENETELSYVLPENKNQFFAAIFKDLETNEEQLGLRGFGVSLTTLEEVFLKLSKAEKLSSSPSNQSAGTMTQTSATRITLNDNQYLLRGFPLLMNQSNAMLRKRCLGWLRSLPSFCYYNAFVVVVMSLIIFQFDKLFSSSRGLPALDINFNKYVSPIVMLQNSSTSSFIQQYEADIKKSSVEVQLVNNDMEATLLEVGKRSLSQYNFQYLVAASVASNGTIFAWFNSQAVHSAALALNLVHNALVKTLFGADYSIQVTNAPLDFKPTNDTDIVPTTVDAFGYSFSMGLGLVFSVLSASYISFYIKEQECNARFLQYASGVNVAIFWGASVLWDLMTNCITAMLIIIMLVFGQHDKWKSPSELAIIFFIMFMYNFAMMPVICILSLLFKKPSFGMNVISIFNFFIMMVYLLNVELQFLKTFIAHILWTYPLCTIMDGIMKLPKLHSIELECREQCQMIHCDWNELCSKIPECCPGNIFSWNQGIGKNLTLMLCTGIAAFIVLVLIERGALRMAKQFIFQYIKRTFPPSVQAMDDDVFAERERIANLSIQELKAETIVMKNVSKFYGKFCAVDRFSMSIKRGECFGLLGKNGAGKSSIFKVLTGETIISDGTIFTQGYNQKYQINQIYQMIGYCPQFDALLSGLTCRETLEIFALVRGVPVRGVKNYVENCARDLDFIQHIDKKVKQLSGGNKRKLSTSLAMTGNVSVIFLDEPTTGLDPATKRNLWNVAIHSRESGRSIVLTSHSMEECEALCTRITVLVNGQAKCLGSSQSLKTKFCKGFELKIKIEHDNETYERDLIEVKNFIQRTFIGAIFREEYQGVLTYSIPAEDIKWSSVFAVMENAKKTLKIEDYAVSQHSLEQVVLMFVKDQRDQQIHEENIN